MCFHDSNLLFAKPLEHLKNFLIGSTYRFLSFLSSLTEYELCLKSSFCAAVEFIESWTLFLLINFPQKPSLVCTSHWVFRSSLSISIVDANYYAFGKNHKKTLPHQHNMVPISQHLDSHSRLDQTAIYAEVSYASTFFSSYINIFAFVIMHI